MRYLFDLTYLTLLAAAFPWLLWQAFRKGKYREGYAAKLLGRVPRREGKETCLWFHAVSVGEANLLKPLLEQVRRRHPRWRCVLSTTTKTGMDLAKKRYPDLSVFYCPLDFSWAVAEAMRRVRPDVLVLAELELWPNLIAAARRRGAKVAVVNGRLSEHSAKGYSRIRPVVKRILKQVDVLAVQDATYAERFRRLGATGDSVQVTGSMKYDGAETDRRNEATTRLTRLWPAAESGCVFLAGSTQEPEEALALDAYLELVETHPELRLILVPRHPDRFEPVAALLDTREVRWQRRTELDTAPPDPAAKVLLVDVIGELGAWWGTAEIAYVGGSMGARGGQNMIEPAAYGAAVSFGPNTRNFRDIVAALLDRDAALVLHSGDELTAFVRRCLEDRDFRERLGRSAQQLVREQLGATRRTLLLLDSVVGGDSPRKTVPPPMGRGRSQPKRSQTS